MIRAFDGLGGPQFLNDTGVAIAQGFDDILDLLLPDNNTGGNVVRIETLWSGDFELSFYHIDGISAEELKCKHSGVSTADLRQVFCGATGLCS